MVKETYPHIDSSYRNRAQWPSPSNFEVHTNNGGHRIDSANASDPVCNSTPIVSWSSNRFDIVGGGATLNGVVENVTSPIANLMDAKTFIVRVDPAETQQQLENYYKGAIITNSTLGEYRRITWSKYAGLQGTNEFIQIQVDRPFSDSFTIADVISINDPSQLNITDKPVLFVPTGSDEENTYKDYLILNETTREYRTISEYDHVSHMITINNTDPISWNLTDNYSICRTYPYIFGPVVSATTSQITIPLGSINDNEYVGSYIRIAATSSERYNYGLLSTPISETRRIVAYNGTTRVASVTPAFSTAVTSLTNPYIHILPFSRDNNTPIIYLDRSHGVDHLKRYEIELINLTIPNTILSSGSKPNKLPYLWVDISNITFGSGAGDHIVHSNNPNSRKMKFLVPIDDCQSNTSFLSLSSSGMKQTINFKPNDNLRITLRTPSGEILNTKIDEYFSPREPNPEKQVSIVLRLTLSN